MHAATIFAGSIALFAGAAFAKDKTETVIATIPAATIVAPVADAASTVTVTLGAQVAVQTVTVTRRGVEF
jgi:hypothetical protein